MGKKEERKGKRGIGREGKGRGEGGKGRRGGVCIIGVRALRGIDAPDQVCCVWLNFILPNVHSLNVN